MPTSNMICFWCKDKDGKPIPLEQKGGGVIAIHFVCPECGGSWWPPEDDSMTDGEVLFRAQQESVKKMVAKHGGGNKAAGRKRERPKPQMKRFLPE